MNLQQNSDKIIHLS